MAHFAAPTSSRGLMRQELYSYGFKEGQPWAEDRRALESALHAMDKLERDIQRNYIYGRSAPPVGHYNTSASTSRRMSGGGGVAPGKYYSSGRYPAPVPVSSYSGRGYEYDPYGAPDPMGYTAAPQASWYQSPPVNVHDSTRSWSGTGTGPPPNFQSYPQQYYMSPPPPSIPSHVVSPSISNSSSRNYRSAMVDDSPPQRQYSSSPGSVSDYYGSRGVPSVAGSLQSAGDPMQVFSPSQMQLVAYDDHGVRGTGQDDASDESDPEAVRYSASAASQQWSMGASQGAPSERVLSDTSSPAMHSDGSDLSGYSDATRSSGYVESYDVASHGSYRGDYQDSDDERDYMSDDVASNEGEYYSSGDEPEYDGEGEDVYSDGGYSDDEGSYSEYYD